MKLRTAYCLNALFQRRDATRLLNTSYSRIDIIPAASNENRIVVRTPDEAAKRLSAFLEPGHPLFRDSRPGIAPVEFVIEGLIHDPFARTDHVVEALSLKFFDGMNASLLAINERFLKGLIHCDSMPDSHGPDIGSLIATLRCAGDSWASVDFLYNIARRHAA